MQVIQISLKVLTLCLLLVPTAKAHGDLESATHYFVGTIYTLLLLIALVVIKRNKLLAIAALIMSIVIVEMFIPSFESLVFHSGVKVLIIIGVIVTIKVIDWLFNKN